jgi:hypothetical protein
VLADYELQEVNVAQLPVRVESLSPLHIRVTAPEDNLILVTPRAFLPGYTARVNQVTIRVFSSRDRQVAIPLHARSNDIELLHPASRSLQVWFWISAATCLGLGAWLAGLLLGVGEKLIAPVLRATVQGPARWVWRHRLAGGIGARQPPAVPRQFRPDPDPLSLSSGSGTHPRAHPLHRALWRRHGGTGRGDR